jgi:Flp pilus assembly protein TadD
VDDADYTWRPYDYLSICHDKVGRKREAIDAAIKALDGNPERERIITNLHFMVQAL